MLFVSSRLRAQSFKCSAYAQTSVGVTLVGTKFENVRKIKYCFDWRLVVVIGYRFSLYSGDCFAFCCYLILSKYAQRLVIQFKHNHQEPIIFKGKRYILNRIKTFRIAPKWIRKNFHYN